MQNLCLLANNTGDSFILGKTFAQTIAALCRVFISKTEFVNIGKFNLIWLLTATSQRGLAKYIP